jgi:C1A family cysteine protease
MKRKFVTSITKGKLLPCLIIGIVVTSGLLQLVRGNQTLEASIAMNDDAECNKQMLAQQPGEKQGEKTFSSEPESTYEPLSVMKVDPETLQQWQDDYSTAQEAFIDPALKEEVQTASSFSILDHLSYIPSERNQGWCGNCWAWPSTAVVAIALDVQKGIFERLSVQYINSCGEDYTSPPYQIKCCEGGNLQMFSTFYRNTGKAIPWSNTNAQWQDDHALCLTPCGSISTTPSYPITSISTVTIRTHRVDENVAIDNIKNVLHQEKGVYFTILFPDLATLEDFQNFWRNDVETYVYNLDYNCGVPFREDEAAGHAVLCVGYVDDPDTNNNDYWIMLNSWGTRAERPNGLFYVNMHMNYSCRYSNYYAFGAETLNIVFKEDFEAPYTPEIDGPNQGKPRTTYKYVVSAIDPQGDDVYFTVDWGDGTVDGWLGPVTSGEQFDVEHSWDRQGNYTISVKAKDIHGNESYWTTFSVTMPKNKLMNPLILQFLERFRARFPFFDKIFPIS